MFFNLYKKIDVFYMFILYFQFFVNKLNIKFGHRYHINRTYPLLPKCLEVYLRILPWKISFSTISSKRRVHQSLMCLSQYRYCTTLSMKPRKCLQFCYIENNRSKLNWSQIYQYKSVLQ